MARHALQAARQRPRERGAWGRRRTVAPLVAARAPAAATAVHHPRPLYWLGMVGVGLAEGMLCPSRCSYPTRLQLRLHATPACGCQHARGSAAAVGPKRPSRERSRGSCAPPLLCCAVGQEYVQTTLTTMDPMSAIQAGWLGFCGPGLRLRLPEAPRRCSGAAARRHACPPTHRGQPGTGAASEHMLGNPGKAHSQQ